METRFQSFTGTIYFYIKPLKLDIRNSNTFSNLFSFTAQVSDAQKLRGGIHFVTKLPKNPTGKVQRRLVQEMVAQL